MQRVFLLLSALLALYVSGFACATTEPLAPGDEKPEPHIALLLPLQSAVFGTAADTVRQGFEAAAILERQGLPVRIYGCSDESTDITTLYHHAIGQGALAVVGPLTRSGTSALATEQNFPVPTLALNTAEDPSVDQLFFFGMAAEAEAKQVARLVKQHGLHQVIILTTQAQLSKRLQFAFEEEWNSLGGIILREVEFNDDPAVLADITDLPDTAIFLAADAGKARRIRPYLLNKLPIYATSQIFVGNSDSLTNYDLNGIRFVDMPWLLQDDHPAVMTYPRANPPLSADRERLYALGIDAFRLIQLLLANQINTALPLDGVSGDIQLHGHVFQRTALPAVLAQGFAQLTNTRAWRAQLPNTHASPDVPILPAPTISEP